MDKGQPVSAGQLRWLVTLAARSGTPTGDTDITQTITPIAEVHASIEPVSLQTYVNGVQIDMPVTHKIIFRWQPFANLGMFNVILRTTVLPDNQKRTETFRVSRAQEFQGRHRFIICEATLEVATDA